MSNSFTNLQEIDQEQAFNLLKFFIRSNQNIFLFGKRGTGKTELAIQAIEACNMKVSYINLSVIERADLAGYPNMSAPGDIITFKSPYFLPTLLEKKSPNSVVLFDEVDKASPDVTAPLLEILQFKTINGKPLNLASCILTGNLINEGAYSNQISSALLDRGSKYILSFNFEKWLDWARLNNIHDLILGFLNTHPEFACSSNNNYYAEPSPRGWKLASDALFKTKDLKINDTESIINIISGFVGKDIGLRFKIWYENYKKFDPLIHSLIEFGNPPLNFQDLMPTEKLIFVISSCYFAKQKILQNKNNFIYLENLCNFFNTFKVDPELQILAMSNSFSFEFITKYKLYSYKPFFDHFTKLNENINFKK
jgi:hypothetical protein